MSSFAGKVILITGASSGIGAGTAEYLAKLGANIALIGRNHEKLNSTEENCHRANPNANTHIINADVTKDHKDIIERTVKHYGKLDVLVNNAGIFAFGSIEDADVNQFDRMLNTNLRAAFQLTKAAIPHLEKTHGNIVNVSSTAGVRAFSGAINYCISKAAIDQLTKCTALELAAKKIRVNAVSPGVVRTDLQINAGMDERTYERYLRQCEPGQAFTRCAEVEEIASGIAYLASDEASFITGALLPIDGGKQAMCPN